MVSVPPGPRAKLTLREYLSCTVPMDPSSNLPPIVTIRRIAAPEPETVLNASGRRRGRCAARWIEVRIVADTGRLRCLGPVIPVDQRLHQVLIVLRGLHIGRRSALAKQGPRGRVRLLRFKAGRIGMAPRDQRAE